MSEFQPIVSSNLHSAAYDAQGKMMYVRFRQGTEYRYEGVLAEEWAEFGKLFDGTSAISAGKWFAKNRQIWKVTRLEDWQK